MQTSKCCVDRAVADLDGTRFRRARLRYSLSALFVYGWVSSLCVVPNACADTAHAFPAKDRWVASGNGVVRDTRSKREWQQADNGEDVDWQAAGAYCHGKGHGWRVPQLAEVKSIYDAHAPDVRCATALCKVPSLFHLSSTWFWSATQVGRDATDGDELAWGVSMTNGAETQAVRDASYGSRVLCVRDL